ncbi:hypothetical protein [Roseibium sediminicola]|uniref:Uncharacterized protein n=1 Tax=Roseibium sediminicola TaxID=2933272 RepID=A0ABT0GXK9_9HYPH|nr:hypothetical protein [Roseibium sp. CAU 1639]MCK7614181.1 hypothetical protein [Roseibium sp. CAU 1639]
MFLFSRIVSAICAIGVAVLLSGLPVQRPFAQEASSADLPELSRPNFRSKFRDNPELARADFNMLPDALREYLQANKDWEKYGISAFSREIRRSEYLIVLKRMKSGSFASKAVVITCCKRGEKSREAGWKPLFLALPVEARKGWLVTIGDNHPNLEWNEDLEAVQSTYCSDVASYACVRHTSKIRRHRQDLIAIEIDETRKGKSWKTIWERGKWLVDPNGYDLTIR